MICVFWSVMKAEKMLLQRNFWVVLVLIIGANLSFVKALPRRILLDTDVDTDDLFALLYLLKLNRSEFELEAVTISTNAWTSAGHAVNQIYDILYMMGRDDVAVGVGGEGGILDDGTIQPNVGGYLSIIEQVLTTTGGCRYRQAIPVGTRGRLDADTNYGLRKAFLPQGSRKYNPLQQSTAQQVMIDKISEGPINVFLIGSHTNFAVFLMSNPHLKKNVEHIYVMGGGIRSENPTGCCPEKASTSCIPRQCGDPGNIFTDYTSNPYAEFNIFGDPFAAYQVIHSGVPLTIVPLDATDTIPVTKNFFEVFEQNHDTFEAQYVFQSLKIARDSRLGEQFYTVISEIHSSLQRPVGLGDVFAVNQSDSISPVVGDCKYAKAIPNGCGGYLDSDTLYGLARNFPRSPRRYAAENPVKHGAPQNSEHPELRQPLAMEIWESILTTLEPGSKISVLTNGPLTNLAKLITSNKNASSHIQEVYVVGGHIKDDDTDKGNVFTVPSNMYAEFNMFLDPLAAKTVFESIVNITLIPLGVQRRVSSFENILKTLHKKKRTPELLFAYRLLSRLFHMKQSYIRYKHVDTFLGEILGAVVLAGDDHIKPVFQFKPVKIFADGVESQDGQTVVYEKGGKLIKILQNLNQTTYFDVFANRLSGKIQSAVIKSFNDQNGTWNKPQNDTGYYSHG